MSSATLATTLPSGVAATCADPLAVGIDLPDLRAGLDVPPDQSTVVPAGDQRRAGQRDAGHVTVMTAQLFGLRLGLVQVDLANREVGAAAEKPGWCRGFRARANTISRRDSSLTTLNFSGFAAGIVRTSEGIGAVFQFTAFAYARTARIGSVPGSVRGTGRTPTMYSF